MASLTPSRRSHDVPDAILCKPNVGRCRLGRPVARESWLGDQYALLCPASQEANALSDTRMVLRLFRNKNLSENDGADTVRRSNVLWDHVARLT